MRDAGLIEELAHNVFVFSAFVGLEKRDSVIRFVFDVGFPRFEDFAN